MRFCFHLLWLLDAYYYYYTHKQTHFIFFSVALFLVNIAPTFPAGPGRNHGRGAKSRKMAPLLLRRREIDDHLDRTKEDRKKSKATGAPVKMTLAYTQPFSIQHANTFLSLFPPFSFDINWILFACAFFPSACSICTCTFRLLCIRRGWWLEEKSSNFANR